MATIGAVLAGGAGRRMRGVPGGKLGALLAGRPLLAYPVEALAGACERVAIICKPATRLPELEGVERWDEPETPRHPLTGIVHALERARAPVLVCGGDMPFVTTDACRTLLAAASGGSAPAAVAVADGVLQPVFGLYAPAALAVLRAAPPDTRLTDAVESLDPVRVALPPRLVESVNTGEELAAAEASLAV